MRYFSSFGNGVGGKSEYALYAWTESFLSRLGEYAAEVRVI